MNSKPEVGIIYRDIVGFDTRFDAFKDLCRDALKDDDFIYLYFDRSERRSEGSGCVCKGSRHEMYIECEPDSNFF